MRRDGGLNVRRSAVADHIGDGILVGCAGAPRPADGSGISDIASEAPSPERREGDHRGPGLIVVDHVH